MATCPAGYQHDIPRRYVLLSKCHRLTLTSPLRLTSRLPCRLGKERLYFYRGRLANIQSQACRSAPQDRLTGPQVRLNSSPHRLHWQPGRTEVQTQEYHRPSHLWRCPSSRSVIHPRFLGYPQQTTSRRRHSLRLLPHHLSITQHHSLYTRPTTYDPPATPSCGTTKPASHMRKKALTTRSASSRSARKHASKPQLHTPPCCLARSSKMSRSCRRG